MQQQSVGGEARIVRTNGWLSFAAVMTGATGALNIVDGLAGLYRTSVFKDTMLVGNLRYWAFAFIVFGVVQVAAGFAIYAGQGWARWFGIVTVALNAFAQLLAIDSYPFYSIAIIAYDVAIFYALGAHWQRRVTPTT
jgi:vacuolar-type H+-ATPase subunit I/STV1